MQDAFLKAIKENDLAALKDLVQQHGTAVALTYQTCKEIDGESVDIELRGEPLNIAVYLRREEMAVFLVEQGAVPESARYSSSSCGNWDEHSVTPIESATSFRMPALTKALMECSHAFDWTYQARVDRDDWAGSREDVSIFQNLLDMDDVMQFIGEVGVFRGMVNNYLVEVRRQGDDFAISIDGVVEHRAVTMEESLHWVWDKCNVVTAESPYESYSLPAYSSVAVAQIAEQAVAVETAVTAEEFGTEDDVIPF